MTDQDRIISTEAKRLWKATKERAKIEGAPFELTVPHFVDMIKQGADTIFEFDVKPEVVALCHKLLSTELFAQDKNPGVSPAHWNAFQAFKQRCITGSIIENIVKDPFAPDMTLKDFNRPAETDNVAVVSKIARIWIESIGGASAMVDLAHNIVATAHGITPAELDKLLPPEQGDAEAARRKA